MKLLTISYVAIRRHTYLTVEWKNQIATNDCAILDAFDLDDEIIWIPVTLQINLAVIEKNMLAICGKEDEWYGFICHIISRVMLMQKTFNVRFPHNIRNCWHCQKLKYNAIVSWYDVIRKNAVIKFKTWSKFYIPSFANSCLTTISINIKSSKQNLRKPSKHKEKVPNA